MAAYPDYNSPLSRLIDDDNLTIIENLIPYCSAPIAKFLAIGMKLTEIQKIMTGFDDADRLHACGFEENAQDMESVLRSLKSAVSTQKAQQIDNVLSLLRFSKVYEKYNQIMAEHPELSRGLSAAGNSDASDTTGNGAEGGGPFADPALFFVLNSLMNNGQEGMSDGRIKQFLEIARTTGGENKDMGGLLSALLKK